MNIKKPARLWRGFTLIELLVTIGIIGILIGISVFGLQGARESSRDAKRKADLEQIRSGVELYRADCNVYPASLTSPLKGTGSPPACNTNNVYIQAIPIDPVASRAYLYAQVGAGSRYELCASLENGTGSVTCGGSSNCGVTCNYKVTNP